ncbi:hypothetical protein SAMN05421781_0437 [Marinococcus luteus]|uniref:Uncharacterized protein n=1 Tax=Marinococcus luteus TaxID=1122204 RepID=A0A1H2QSG1_9BACI|nr:hypothetical protein SAMN05421781_0437 [Marinococcus luteus]
MPEFFPIAGVLGLLMSFLLKVWIVPKEAVLLRDTKGQYEVSTQQVIYFPERGLSNDHPANNGS